MLPHGGSAQKEIVLKRNMLAEDFSGQEAGSPVVWRHTTGDPLDAPGLLPERFTLLQPGGVGADPAARLRVWVLGINELSATVCELLEWNRPSAWLKAMEAVNWSGSSRIPQPAGCHLPKWPVT
jgi:hypothetical protein